MLSVAIIGDLVFDSFYIHVGAWRIFMLFPDGLTNGNPRALLPTLNVVGKYFSSLRAHKCNQVAFPNRLPFFIYGL